MVRRSTVDVRYDADLLITEHRLGPGSEGWLRVPEHHHALGGTPGRTANPNAVEEAAGARRQAGCSVLFLTLETLMGRLARARHENRIDRTLQHLSAPRPLILDGLGYLPLSREEASLFFRVLVRRCERGSLIVTSNKSFVDWG